MLRMDPYLTIGQLAQQVGLRTSALRYYENEGLLLPVDRTSSGYRLYAPEAVQRVQLIQRAQRLGFSLADIRPLMEAWETGDLEDEALISVAENRYLEIEKQVTERLVLQHELELFLQDLRRESGKNGKTAFDDLLNRVCVNPDAKSSTGYLANWLMEKANCNLTTETGQAILRRLRGQHVHLWQEKGAYHALFVSDDPQVAEALQELAELEAGCKTHPNAASHFAYGDEGYLFTAGGESAFIIARLFLALERETP